ncbi:MAG TPA: PH domain-containing protein [Bacteroidales bacterium]|nr:PH domain-containing protein [Bacteroidales bacterium]
MTSIDFTQENRLPLSAVFFLIIVSMKNATKQLWPVLLVIFVSKDDFKLFWKIIIALLVILLFGVIRGVLMYRNFTYAVKGDELIVKKGVLKKTTLSIPLHKIQNISNRQGFWQQILDITTLSVDTAGSTKSEMEIYLDIKTSDAFKEFILHSKKESIATQTNESESETAETHEPAQVLKTYFYDTRQLMLAAISRNHLRGLSIMLLLFFSAFNQLGESLQKQMLEYTWAYIPKTASLIYWLTVIVFILIISMVLNFVHTCLKYYNLNVNLYDNRVTYKAGLIKNIQQVIHLDKIQVIVQTANVFEKMLNTSSLRVHQFLNLGEKAQKEVAFFLPGFLQSRQLTENIYPEMTTEEFSEVHSKKNFFRRQLYFYAGIPTAILTGLAFFDIRSLYLIVPVLAIAATAAWFRYRKSRAEIGNRYVQVYAGVFGDKISTLKVSNIQSVKLRQSIFQERTQTASVVISTRWASLNIPFLEEQTAREVVDYLLFRLEFEN